MNIVAKAPPLHLGPTALPSDIRQITWCGRLSMRMKDPLSDNPPFWNPSFNLGGLNGHLLTLLPMVSGTLTMTARPVGLGEPPSTTVMLEGVDVTI